MKKNKMMRVASVLLIAVLLSTCVISGTFAKYVTSDNVGDSARVAKFGVVVTGSGSLFDETYKTAENTPGNAEGEAPDYEDEDKAVYSVESFNGDKLVAPGTKNDDGLTVSITGTPEVDVQVTVEVTDVKEIFLAAGTWVDMTTGDADDAFTLNSGYFPVRFTLTQTLTVDGDEETTTLAENVRLKDIKSTLEGLSNSYDANTDLAEVIGTLNLTWEWAFGDPKWNQADTLLGDLAAGIEMTANDLGEVPGTGDFNLETSVKLTVTVTQVD